MRILALPFLIILAPITLLISIFIFMDINENVIFQQTRIGFQKKEFKILKFKTMKNGKISFSGKILRKLGLDEIPQLINIIKGEMSFIGPRPLTLKDINRLNWNTKKYLKRWSVKPGITGLAQLNKVCNAELSISNDFHYIDNKNILLDIKIFTKSLLVPILGKLTK